MHEEAEEAARERRARSHSTRVAIITLLAEDRELTVPQIRAELPDDFTLRNLYYHLRVLEVSHLLARDGNRYRLI